MELYVWQHPAVTCIGLDDPLIASKYFGLNVWGWVNNGGEGEFPTIKSAYPTIVKYGSKWTMHKIWDELQRKLALIASML